MTVATGYLDRAVVTMLTAPGTGAISPGTAPATYQTLAQAGAQNGVIYPYSLVDGSNWEFGFGTYLTAGPNFQRTTILGSSSGGSAINASIAAILTSTFLAEDAGKLLPGSAFLASPPDIGQTTPGHVAIKGITSGAAIAAGTVGEVISASVLKANAVTLATGVTSDITSMPLSAGFWLVSGQIGTKTSSTTTTDFVTASIGPTSATIQAASANLPIGGNGSYVTAGDVARFGLSAAIMNVAVSTTVYLSVQASFSGTSASCTAFGSMQAVRIA